MRFWQQWIPATKIHKLNEVAYNALIRNAGEAPNKGYLAARRAGIVTSFY